MLLKRKIAFRIPFIVLAALSVRIEISDGNVLFALMMAAWVIYTFNPGRVRVFCGIRPKRPAPMPAPAAEQAHWDASGLKYTDEKGQATDFSGACTQGGAAHGQSAGQPDRKAAAESS